MMITTVTLNPAIDYTLYPERFSIGDVCRCEECVRLPGGKGINVSLLLTSLGVQNTALAVAGGFTGREIARLMKEAGCQTDFLYLPRGDSRINVKIRTPDGKETDLNPAGPAVPPETLEQLVGKLSALPAGGGLVLAGSVPPSLPADTYARLLRRVEGKDLLTVVDTSGDALLAALSCRPFLIKPNLEELGQACGIEVHDVMTAKECARELQDRGARNVAVSMGEKGALLVEENGKALFCRAPKGISVSTVGAGDSLVAGFLYGWQLHGTLEGALRWGVAAGSATAFSQGIAAGEQVKSLWPQVGTPQPL